MDPWFEVVKPYQFIESLGKREDLLVADLGDVLTGVAHPIYLDPELFVKTTYFTDGLLNFLESIQRKITTGEGNSVIRLQTRFGGGKTHSLIAVHHLLTNQKFFFGKIPISTLQCKPKIVRIIGTHLNPLSGRQVKDNRIYTPWGELAYQLRGVEGYLLIRENDQKRVSPGKASLFTLLSSNEPTVILLDEITEFITKARGVKVNDSNLGLQTLTFLQELTECIRVLEKSILIIALPDREYEASNKGETPVLIEINQILGRLASSIIPSERADLYQIVQKKLIEEVLDDNSLIQILDQFSQFFCENRKDFPDRASTHSYYSIMKNAYPFHPATIDLLIEKWNNLVSFQGTRTILSTLARILYELRKEHREISIINPSDIDFSKKSQSLLFFQHLPSKFKEILSQEYYLFENPSHLKVVSDNWEELSKKIISIIFLNSIPTSVNHGISPQEINLAIWKPDVDLALVSETLNALSYTSEFLHRTDSRYAFSQAPNINYKIKELKNQLENEALKEIKITLNSQTIDYPIRVFIWPNSADEIPDDPIMKMVLISPFMEELNYSSWIRFKGEKFREFQNTLLFGKPNITNFDRLREFIQEKIAINRILQKKEADFSFREELQGLKSRLITSEKGIEYLWNRIYLEFTDSIHQYSLNPPKISEELSLKWVIHELIGNEVIVEKIHPSYIKENFLNKTRKIDTFSILNQFMKDLKMPKLLNEKVLERSLLEGLEKKIFSFEDTSDTFKLPNSTQYTLFSDSISFKNTEFIELPNKFGYESLEEGTQQDAKLTPKISRGLSFNFPSLCLSDLRLLRKGILQPLEKEVGEIQLEISIHLKNPEKISNVTTLSLIKETVSQMGGEVNELN